MYENVNSSFENSTYSVAIFIPTNYTQGLGPGLDIGADAEHNSTQPTFYHEPVAFHTAVITGMLLASVVFMTITGNVLVLLAVFVNSHLRSTTNIFIVNLAAADLLLGTTVLPFSAANEILNYWVFGQTFCDIWAAVDVLCCSASIMSLCVISIDRYIGVTRPLQHSTIMTEKRAVIIVLVIWIIATAISVAPLIGWKEPPSEDPLVCTVTQQLGYVMFSVSGSFYIPLIIIIVVYFRIYREASKQSKFLATGIKTSRGAGSSDDGNTVILRVHHGRLDSRQQTPKEQKPNEMKLCKAQDKLTSSSSSDQSDSGKRYHSRLTLAGKMAKFKREKKAAQTLGIVVGVFILCWFPFFFVLPLNSLCKSCSIPEPLFKVIFWLGYCNSMMNPIIYACSSREFKRAFKRILKCQFHRRPRTFIKQELTPMTNMTRLSDRSLLSYRNRLKYTNESESWRKGSNSSPWSSMDGSPVMPCRSLLSRDGCDHHVLDDDDDIMENDADWSEKKAKSDQKQSLRNSYTFSDRNSLKQKRQERKNFKFFRSSVPAIRVISAERSFSVDYHYEPTVEEHSTKIDNGNGNASCHGEQIWRRGSSKC